MKFKDTNTTLDGFRARVAERYSGVHNELSLQLGDLAVKWAEIMETEISQGKRLSYRMVERAYFKVCSGASGAGYSAMVGTLAELWLYGDKLTAVCEVHYVLENAMRKATTFLHHLGVGMLYLLLTVLAALPGAFLVIYTGLFFDEPVTSFVIFAVLAIMMVGIGNWVEERLQLWKII